MQQAPIHLSNALLSPEEVNIRKLLHLLHIRPLSNLLIIKQHPRLLSVNNLANKRNVMPRVNRRAFMAYNRLQLELRR